MLTAALLGLFSFTPLLAQTSSVLVYKFDSVKRTVTVSTNSAEARTVSAGGRAASGDRVHTGWFSSAVVADEQHRATFELFARTDVILASTTPGVILSLERGRLEAIFDKITGSEPRIVQTPGALLAVRGTSYAVEVDAKGETALDVFEGTVEVSSPLKPLPFLVHAGESSDFGRNRVPVVLPTPPERRQPQGGKRNDDHGDRNGNNRPQGGQGGHNDPGHRGGGNNPQPRPSGPGPQPPPPPPPQKPPTP
jgi:hypothetical protein